MPGKFEIKSFRGGKSEFLDRGIVGAFKMAKNCDIRGVVDSLTCNQALVAEAADTVVDLIRFWVNGEDGNGYGFGSTGKVYKRTSAGAWSVVYTETNGAILGAAEWYNDTPKTYLYWATSTKLHRKELPGASDWSDVDAGADWPRVNLSAADWHTMAQADGSLMICNAKKLAMVGFDDSYTNEALMLRYGMVAKTVNEYGNSVLVGGGDGVRNSWLLTWDHTAQNWTSKNRIPAKSINGVVDAEVMLMNCGDNELFFSNMTDKMRVMTMDGKCNPGGVAEDNGLALFGIYGGSFPGIWSFGRRDKNGLHSLNLEHYIDADEIGAVWFVGDTLFASYKKGTSYGVYKVSLTAKATAEYYSLDLKLPKESAVSTVELLTDELPEGCEIELYYAPRSLTLTELLDSSNWVEAKLTSGDAFDSGRDPVFMIGSSGRIFNLKLVLKPSANTAPVVHQLYLNFL